METSVLRRIAGVFRLKKETFEEVEHDRAATGQAAMVVLLAALGTGLGSALLAALGDGNFLVSFASLFLWAFVAWALVSGITYFIGTILFAGKATPGEMLRVIGFAFAPLTLGIIPCVGDFIGALWAMIAGFIAVRQGLDLDDLRAALTVLLSFAAYLAGRFLLSIFVSSLFGIFP
jgi:hypothetical protein